jgi:hypothetical protein
MKHSRCTGSGNVIGEPGNYRCDGCNTKGTHLNEYTDGTGIHYGEISEADREIHDKVDKKEAARTQGQSDEPEASTVKRAFGEE